MGSDLRLSQTYRDDSGEIPKDTVEHVKQDIDQPAGALGKDRNVLPEQIYQDRDVSRAASVLACLRLGQITV